MNNWTEERINNLIIDQVQESLWLEYKGAESLSKSDGKKKEITKDVSSMANSDGGTIVFGIKEFDLKSKKHLPEKIDPVDQSLYTKEWLQQIINNIQPKINGLVITPVPVKNNKKYVIYVVEIPKGKTAHQATDYRYYKRYNGISVPMNDYEIRDILNRVKHSYFDISFKIKEHFITITIYNISSIYAKYVNIFLRIPKAITYDSRMSDKKTYNIDNKEYYFYEENNTQRDIVDSKPLLIGQTVSSNYKYGPSWFNPILPGMSYEWSIDLDWQVQLDKYKDLRIYWKLYADNSTPDSGDIILSDIEGFELLKIE